jgi:YggT family protein
MNPLVLFLTLLRLLEFIVLADALFSWFAPSKDQFPRSLTSQIADPLCAPFRKLLGPESTGGMDFSPILVMFALDLMRNALTGL